MTATTQRVLIMGGTLVLGALVSFWWGGKGSVQGQEPLPSEAAEDSASSSAPSGDRSPVGDENPKPRSLRPASLQQPASYQIADGRDPVFRSWQATENLELDESCRAVDPQKIQAWDAKLGALKRFAKDAHPFDASLASGFSNFERGGRHYQFSLSQSGSQTDSGEELFRFLLTSSASADPSAPFRQEKFDDPRYSQLVTQADGRALWESFVSELRSQKETVVSEVRYRAFADGDSQDMFEVSNGVIVGFSGQDFGCQNEELAAKLPCSCRISFAD